MKQKQWIRYKATWNSGIDTTWEYIELYHDGDKVTREIRKK